MPGPKGVGTAPAAHGRFILAQGRAGSTARLTSDMTGPPAGRLRVTHQTLWTAYRTAARPHTRRWGPSAGRLRVSRRTWRDRLPDGCMAQHQCTGWQDRESRMGDNLGVRKGPAVARGTRDSSSASGCRRLPWPWLLRVRGVSMSPTYLDGDLLLALRGVRPRAGVAVVRLPPDAMGRPRPIAVKRLSPAVEEPGRWWVSSDDPRGVGSATIGTLGGDDVLGRVLVRLTRTRRRRGATRRTRL